MEFLNHFLSTCPDSFSQLEESLEWKQIFESNRTISQCFLECLAHFSQDRLEPGRLQSWKRLGWVTECGLIYRGVLPLNDYQLYVPPISKSDSEWTGRYAQFLLGAPDPEEFLRESPRFFLRANRAFLGFLFLEYWNFLLLRPRSHGVDGAATSALLADLLDPMAGDVFLREVLSFRRKYHAEGGASLHAGVFSGLLDWPFWRRGERRDAFLLSTFPLLAPAAVSFSQRLDWFGAQWRRELRSASDGAASQKKEEVLEPLQPFLIRLTAVSSDTEVQLARKHLRPGSIWLLNAFLAWILDDRWALFPSLLRILGQAGLGTVDRFLFLLVDRLDGLEDGPERRNWEELLLFFLEHGERWLGDGEKLAYVHQDVLWRWPAARLGPFLARLFKRVHGAPLPQMPDFDRFPLGWSSCRCEGAVFGTTSWRTAFWPVSAAALARALQDLLEADCGDALWLLAHLRPRPPYAASLVAMLPLSLATLFFQPEAPTEDGGDDDDVGLCAPWMHEGVAPWTALGICFWCNAGDSCHQASFYADLPEDLQTALRTSGVADYGADFVRLLLLPRVLRSLPDAVQAVLTVCGALFGDGRMGSQLMNPGAFAVRAVQELLSRRTLATRDRVDVALRLLLEHCAVEEALGAVDRLLLAFVADRPQAEDAALMARRLLPVWPRSLNTRSALNGVLRGMKEDGDSGRGGRAVLAAAQAYLLHVEELERTLEKMADDALLFRAATQGWAPGFVAWVRRRGNRTGGVGLHTTLDAWRAGTVRRVTDPARAGARGVRGYERFLEELQEGTKVTTLALDFFIAELLVPREGGRSFFAGTWTEFDDFVTKTQVDEVVRSRRARMDKNRPRKVLMPVHQVLDGGVGHFVLLMADLDAETLHFIDSLGIHQEDKATCQRFVAFLKDACPHFWEEKPSLRFKPKRCFPVKKTAPQAGNVIDCGIFVYAFMEYLMDGKDLANMHLAVRLSAIPEIRKRIFFQMIKK